MFLCLTFRIPSNVSCYKAEHQILLPSASEMARLQTTAPTEEPPRKKRKGPKGPNPLSVKKKKAVQPAASAPKAAPTKGNEKISHTGEKRKRPEHDAAEPTHLDEASKPGRKRKRRRKVANMAAEGGEGEASEEE